MINEHLLWKFRGANHQTLSLIINKEIWFSKSTSFNDPFDAQRNPEVVLLNFLENKLIKGSRYVESSIRSILPNINVNNKYAYFCMSKEYDETLMWSHYANSHTGIAIGFDENFLDNIILNKNLRINMHPISYSENIYNELMTIANRMLDSESQLKNIENLRRDEYKKGYFANSSDATKQLGRQIASGSARAFDKISHHIRYFKSSSWSYEKEYRIEVDLSSGGEHYYHEDGVALRFDSKSIKHVIFGLNCSDLDRKTIINLMSNEDYSHVLLWDAVRDDSAMKVKVKEITKS